LPNSDGVAYLTYFGILPEYRCSGYATALIDNAEKILRDDYSAKRIDIVFYNPAHLPWIIPGSTDGHPCAPGIKTDSPAARLLLNRGYSEWCAQIAYYMPLSEYKTKEEHSARLASLAETGIRITYYDPANHHGLYELFDAIRNPGWRKTVMAHLDQPIVVAVDHNKNGLIVGYTGPLSQVREGNGIRGNFCGIGTHPDYRGRGIGTLIFCEMCRHHSQSGATFMSLYTGENNPARRVYESAGLRATVRWSNLRLNLQ
jgi:ribosomal protein S18 acetylase RimI-like enzyme